LVESVEDVLEEIGGQLGLPFAAKEPENPTLEGDEASVYAAITAEPVHVDELGGRLGLAMSRLMTVLCILEIKRLIRQHPGKRFSR
jgi:DNA processing protein